MTKMTFLEKSTITNRRVCLWSTTITNICKEGVGRIIMGSLRLGDSMMIPYIAFHDNDERKEIVNFNIDNSEIEREPIKRES